MHNEQNPASVRSVDKAMELIEALLSRRAPMTLRELSAAVGYPKSTVHALLSTLRTHGMVSQGEDGRYALGIRLFECGCAVSDSWDLSRTARAYLEKLADETDGSAFLSVLEDSYVISLDQCTGGSGVQVIPEVGSRLPLHATSQGKMLLATLSDSEIVKRMQRTGMAAYTPHTIADTETLLSRVAQIRQNGYAIEDGEYKIGLRAVSAPVYDVNGRACCAIGVVGLFRKVSSEEFQRIIAQVVRQAARLSHALGYRTGKAPDIS